VRKIELGEDVVAAAGKVREAVEPKEVARRRGRAQRVQQLDVREVERQTTVDVPTRSVGDRSGFDPGCRTAREQSVSPDLT
jgi:hypothetical protein